jgi:hypothetical protein
MAHRFRLTAITVLAVLVAGCTKPDARQQSEAGGANTDVAAAMASDAKSVSAEQQQPRRPVRIDDAHLENVYQVHAKVISGGEPHGPKGV